MNFLVYGIPLNYSVFVIENLMDSVELILKKLFLELFKDDSFFFLFIPKIDRYFSVL